MRKIVRCSIGVGLALLLPIPLFAQEQCENRWRPLEASSGQFADIPALEQLAREFSESGSVRLRLLTALLDAERNAEAVAVAQSLAADGYSFGAGAAAMLAGYGATPEWRTANSANGEPIAASVSVAQVPEMALLVESAWHHPETFELFATSVVSQGLFVRRNEEGWQQIALANSGSLTGMAFDRASGTLWIAAGVTQVTPDPANAFRGLIAIDPLSRRELRRVTGGADGSPSDLVVGAEGVVYASDPVSGAIYRTSHGNEMLETVLPPGTLRSPQGIVELADGRLIVSDYRYGLALVDQQSGCIVQVTTDLPLLLDGIDGLWLHDQMLIAVQNGTRPMRIMAFTLSLDATTIIGARVLEQSHPDWTEPLGGSLEGGGLLYVANGQWERFEPGGALVEEASPEPTQIRWISLAGNVATQTP